MPDRRSGSFFAHAETPKGLPSTHRCNDPGLFCPDIVLISPGRLGSLAPIPLVHCTDRGNGHVSYPKSSRWEISCNTAAILCLVQCARACCRYPDRSPSLRRGDSDFPSVGSLEKALEWSSDRDLRSVRRYSLQSTWWFSRQVGSR